MADAAEPPAPEAPPQQPRRRGGGGIVIALGCPSAMPLAHRPRAVV
jgi:hypothetical protein